MLKKKLLLLFLWIAALNARTQTVDFSFITNSGLFCSPQRVIFTQNCSNNPGGFIWNFGNGSSSVHGTDSTIYLNAGTYNVTLTGLYADSAIVKTKTITINPTPAIAITTNTDSLCQPGTINFTATGSSSVSSYEWNFGDGGPVEISSNNSISHNFSTYQNYTVIVKGITVFGCYAQNVRVVKVEKFNISGTRSPSFGCIPQTVSYNVISHIASPDIAQNYSWNFGDGSPALQGTNAIQTHLYNVTDTAVASVIVTSTTGCTSTYTFLPVAFGIPPTNTHLQTLSGRDTFCGNEVILIKGTAVNANFYNFNFGVGNFSNQPDSFTSTRYRDTGWKMIVVTPFFNGCAGPKDTISVYIKGVIAKFDFGNTCAQKNDYLFQNISTGIITDFLWQFSDDASIKDSVHTNVNHVFPVSGTYVVTLIVRDSVTTCADTLLYPIYTAQPAFASNTFLVCKDSVAHYKVSNTYSPQSPARYTFHVNGDIVYNAADSILNYTSAAYGTFFDYVVITDNIAQTCDDTLYLPVATRVAGPLTNFTAPARLCRNERVIFTNLTQPYFAADSINTWHWDFWDGTTDNLKNTPPHLYSSPGTFVITLTATDINGCAQKKQQNILLDPAPEITVYPRIDTICQGRDTAVLTAYSIDPFIWSPNVNISCNNCDTITAYPNISTTYIAKATNISGCNAVDSSVLKVFAPLNITLSQSAFEVCPKTPVSFNTNVNGITIWEPNIYLDNASIANPTAIADSNVTYRIIVKDSAGCFADTASASIKVFPPPVVNAEPNRRYAYGTNFILQPQYSNNITFYLWAPAGDLDCINCPNPTGIVQHAINYIINVVSNKGCKAKDSIAISFTCANSNIYMPSAFTPGNAGPNNYFYPITRGFKTIKTFIIYNRYGNKVFERQNFSPNVETLGWNGFTGTDNRGDNTQAYVWYLEAICEQGENFTTKGTVVLVK